MKNQVTTGLDVTGNEARRLYMALELSKSRWLVGSATGPGGGIRRVGIRGGDWARLLEEIQRSLIHHELSGSSEVLVCYEAGRDGFWLSRCLEQHGIGCLVVDAGSIRRRQGKRHVKTDRLDVERLLRDLMRYASGETDVWRTVRVPPESIEDLRQLQRERSVLISERTAHWNRVLGLLVSRGIRMEKAKLQSDGVTSLRTWDGKRLGVFLEEQLGREFERIELLGRQLKELEARRRALLKESPAQHAQSLECVKRLLRLRGLGEEGAWTLAVELFAWREFRNRREIGGYMGLCGTPFSSGDSHRDLGIGKDGPGWIRALVIELSWGWLTFQSKSGLSEWFREHYGPHGKRSRRRGIVALARRLLVSIWRYLSDGVIPEGAVLKVVAA